MHLDPHVPRRRQVQKNDWYRLGRALTIIETTGRTVSSYSQPENFEVDPVRAVLFQFELIVSSPHLPLRLPYTMLSPVGGVCELHWGFLIRGLAHRTRTRALSLSCGGASRHAHRASQARNLDFRCVFITAPRLDLFARIDHRCEAMMEARQLAFFFGGFF